MQNTLTGRNLSVMMKLLSALMLLETLALSGGCANHATASLIPGADLSKINKIMSSCLR